MSKTKDLIKDLLGAECLSSSIGCPFFKSEEWPAPCLTRGDRCGEESNNFMECSEFGILCEKILIDQMQKKIRGECAGRRCGKIEFNGR